jgi:hypothetical protein
LVGEPEFHLRRDQGADRVQAPGASAALPRVMPLTTAAAPLGRALLTK